MHVFVTYLSRTDVRKISKVWHVYFFLCLCDMYGLSCCFIHRRLDNKNYHVYQITFYFCVSKHVHTYLEWQIAIFVFVESRCQSSFDGFVFNFFFSKSLINSLLDVFFLKKIPSSSGFFTFDEIKFLLSISFDKLNRFNCIFFSLFTVSLSFHYTETNQFTI